MYQNDALKCITGEVRLSYANLTQPRSNNEGEDPKYSVTLLIPKTDTATKADIDSAIEAAVQEGMVKRWNGARPPMRRSVIHDGDGVKENGEPYGEECKGCWVINAASKQKPDVVHQSNLEVQLAPTDIYSGMYARVSIRFYPYDFKGNRGVGCGLGNVMKTRDGEPLSSRTTAKSDFADFRQTSAPASYTPPAAGSFPQQPYTPAAQYPQTPAVSAYPQQPQIDPITGRPIVGQVLGL